jgi:hypothetical protein
MLIDKTGASTGPKPSYKEKEVEPQKAMARRNNKGKLNYMSLPRNALKKVIEVYTRGAHKYSIYQNSKGERITGDLVPFEDVSKLGLTILESGRDNWRKGLSWTDTYDSCMRHIEEAYIGNDIDKELKTKSLANAVWNLLTLLEYEEIFPEGDDRPLTTIYDRNVALDIDEVIADWVGAWCTRWDIEVPTFWNFDRKIVDRFETMRHSGELDEFYLNLKPLITPEILNFEPVCYITARPVSTEITERWLDSYGFPQVPVITVPPGASKVEAALSKNVGLFVDDSFKNFQQLNKGGISTLLMSRPHNLRYKVGNRRINDLSELR